MGKTLSFAEFEKGSKGLLGGYQANQKVKGSTKSASGVEFTCTGVKKDDTLNADIKLGYKLPQGSLDVVIDTNSKITANVTHSNLYPGFKVALNCSVPDRSSGKLSIDYIQSLYTFKGKLGLTSKPKAECSVSAGHAGLSVGAEAGFCTKDNKVTKWGVGAAYAASDYSASAMLLDKADTLKCSFVKAINGVSTVGGEVVRKISKGTTSFTFGGSYKLEQGALVKSKIDNKGITSFLYETQLGNAPSKNKAGFTVQFDTMDLNKNPKMGFSLDIKA